MGACESFPKNRRPSEKLAAVLIEQTDYRRTIRLIDLVQIVKRFYAQFSDFTIEDSLWETYELSKIEMASIQREVRRAVQEKLFPPICCQER